MRKVLYHGSDVDVTELLPLGVDMGMRFQKPKWAVFFWEERELALLWAVFQLIRRSKKVKVMYHVPTGKFIANPIDKSEISKFIGKPVFIYSKSYMFGEYRYGSSPDIHEFTVEGKVIPDSKERIMVSKGVLESSVIWMTPDEMQVYLTDLKSGAFSNRRGTLFSLLMDRERDFKRHKYHELVSKGELNYGDDLSQVDLKSASAFSRW